LTKKGEKGMRAIKRKPLLFFCVLLDAVAFLVAVCPGETPETGRHPPVRWMAFHSYSRNLSTVKQFGELGVNVVTCFPANTLSSVGVPYSPYSPIWLGPNLYDFACLDQQFEDLLRANPQAKIVCEIDLNTPVWWPRWLGAAHDRDDSFTKLGKVAANTTWRQETRAYLQAVLKHLEEKYPERIIAYVLAGGMTLEWQDLARGEESASRRIAWRKWMIDKGFADPVDIPPASVREHVTRGLLRDPSQDVVAIDYWRFNADLIADTILFYARSVQEITKHRVPLGVYYGYWLEHGRGRLLYEGHLAFDQVLRSPDVDFFLAPGSYVDRQLGGASGFMICLASVRHHGKGFVHEVDHRTHTAKSVTLLGQPVPGHHLGFPDEDATIAGLRREFALALINGTAMYWFDMFGHWYEGDRVINAIEQMAALWRQYAEVPSKSVAEVAMFVDAESLFYLDGMAANYNDFLINQRVSLSKMGSPFDVFSFADLGTVDLSRYKMVLFPNLFVVDAEKRKLVTERVCGSGRTVIWVYAPGIISEGRYDPAAVERLTGIPFDTQELTTRSMGNWVSVFSPRPNITAQTLRELAQKAGVHLYCDPGQVVYVNSQFVAFHTAAPGRYTIRLPGRCPRIEELFSGKILAENADSFVLECDKPTTVLCRLLY